MSCPFVGSSVRCSCVNFKQRKPRFLWVETRKSTNHINATILTTTTILTTITTTLTTITTLTTTLTTTIFQHNNHYLNNHHPHHHNNNFLTPDLPPWELVLFVLVNICL